MSTGAIEPIVQVSTVKPVVPRASRPHQNATLRALCRIYKLPEMCWRKCGNAPVIRRLPDMKPEARRYMVKMIRNGWNEKQG